MPQEVIVEAGDFVWLRRLDENGLEVLTRYWVIRPVAASVLAAPPLREDIDPIQPDDVAIWCRRVG